MKLRTGRIRQGVERLISRIGVDGVFREFGDDLPLRSDLFSIDQLERHAGALADWHQLDPKPGADRLLPRLAENERVLLDAHRVVTEAVESDRRVSPASEWLLDNFFLIEEQIRTARRHLPKQYSRSLPRLLNGPSAGYPRVYDLALELISHVDGRVNLDTLNSIVTAYQKRTPLTLGELWAIPIMLRQALIENLRRAASRIAKGTLNRNKASHWADRFMECAQKTPNKLILAVADMVRPDPLLTSAFVAEMARRLRGQGPALEVPLTWIEQRLAESGQTIEQMVQSEGQQQAVDQVSIGNSIGSLRELQAIEWPTFVEAQSIVEQTLLNDPAGVYGRMDFGTRDEYRHVVEVIAKRSRRPEGVIATAAVELARQRAEKPDAESRTAHVGYFLVDKGLPELERATGMRFSLPLLVQRLVQCSPLTFYLGAIFVAAAAATAVVIETLELSSGARWAAGAFLFVGAVHMSVGVVNWLITLLVAPHRLPRMDFSAGIPREYNSLVVVPTMLLSPQNVERLLEWLEVRFLANRDPNLCFGLLTDFRDANQERLPEDEPLLEAAKVGIESLNAKYGQAGDGPFFLFHRPRRWNPQENAWMGFERKRGKLSDLNALLRGGSPDCFSLIVGAMPVLTDVKYVITLDTDTVLPRNAAQQLVATMAHVLNHPRIDKRRNVVTAGYGILQPGVATSLERNGSSWFARLSGGEPGIDPYTRAISDIYQDLFREGSFIGKGIYDVDAFSATMDQRFSDNQILSHDLLEGCYSRSGLASDIQVFESYPSRYRTDVSRRHRWVRGDWQIAQWSLPFIVGPKGLERNPLSMLSRWKIFDNLRRSLVPGTLLLFVLAGWLFWPPVGRWTAVVAGIVLIPALCIAFYSLFRKSADVPLIVHWREATRSLGVSISQATMTLMFLPYEAYVNLDAIVRTVVRTLFTRRRLLEWKTASEAEREGRDGLASAYRTMWVAPAMALLVAIGVAIRSADQFWVAAPLLALWALAPLVAWRSSWPAVAKKPKLSASQTLFLHRMARKTWRFFDNFVGPADHWLPPDNYQEGPVAALAHRTSPTNIGMSLLSTLAAYDFGYLSAGRLIERTTNTLLTLHRLERHRGHFLNWYDTRTLEPLAPRYVSSVDSGNCAGHLLTLRSGLLSLPRLPLVASRLWDSLIVVRDQFENASRKAPRNTKESQATLATLPQLINILPRREPGGAPVLRLSVVRNLLRKLQHALASLPTTEGAEPELADLLRDLKQQCDDHLGDLDHIAPWLAHPSPPASLWRRGENGHSENIDGLRTLLDSLDHVMTLEETANLERHLPSLSKSAGAWSGANHSSPEAQAWLLELHELIGSAARLARERIFAIENLVAQCGELSNIEYEFLYDPQRRQLAIGYNVDERRRDSSFYDLLASEARLGSFVAIAQGHLEQDHWFALGRLLTTANGKPALLSWSGSMFEYLMPLLVMPTYRDTLLDQTYEAVIARQIDYGKQRGIPWGVSESGYNAIDAQQNYQYRAFGIPGLGFKRGLVDDLVVAPYASAMGLMVAPEAACANLQWMADKGYLGQFGFYEAIDYTRSRLAPGQTSAIVRSYMAHHQGMSFLSLAYLLLEKPMQKRFEADPEFQATTLLLQERVPKRTPFHPHSAEADGARKSTDDEAGLLRVFKTPHTPFPEVHLLSNGRYHVMVTNTGGGYSSWKGLALTRWREDATRDDAGAFCFVRDLKSGEFWSTTFQPTRKTGKKYEAIFSQARAEFRRRDGDIKLHTEIAVSPEDDIEIRRSTISNRSKLPQTIELTSYCEVVLAPAAADAAHPAFSNLFVQTEILESRQAILCTRRPRSQLERPPWMLHLMTVCDASTGFTSYETDRSKFIGRGRSATNPQAMLPGAELSNSAGSVLDPIAAIRIPVTLLPDETVIVDLVTGVADTRDGAVGLIDKYRDRHLADRVFDMAWTRGEVVLRQLNASESDAQLFGRIASSVVYASAARRAAPTTLKRNQRGQSGLWGHGISGDLPIVLLRIADAENIGLVRQLVQAHAFWRLKGLAVDLVIWNEGQDGYRQELQDTITGLISGIESQTANLPGGIFVLRSELMAEEDRVLIQTVARVVLSDSDGALAEQLERRKTPDLKVHELVTGPRRQELTPSKQQPRRDLVFNNGLGGFTADGREYVIQLGANQSTPAPWVNVIANATFGTVVSESGGGYSWSENAHEFRLTPWFNDPVTDASGEALYLRDDDSGQFWSPAPNPVRGSANYLCRHGFGYSVFEHVENGISTELWIYVAIDAAVKFSVLKVRNTSGRSRRLSATAYCDWVLGETRVKGLMHVVTEIDPQCGALLARNPYSIDFSDRIAFLEVNDTARSITGDRTEFLGRNGVSSKPAAMGRTRLSGRVGAGFDPCGAMQTAFELPDGREREIVFMLGAGRNVDDVRRLVQQFRNPDAARRALEGVWNFWNRTLGAIHVETPDPTVNILANGWLLYQTLSSRYWGRSGFYQSGGAFGFRDQLQDVAALLHAEPRMIREHLLRCAGRQFLEGDVQHWWHPPFGRGVRTHFSDDFLWLPLIACRYVNGTGDIGVLDEIIPFLESRLLQPEEEANYDLPTTSTKTGSLYEHCVRAIVHGLSFGAHGLPLMGCGDWNDGMNRVGEKGQGESVWLAFFLYGVLEPFAELARQRGDAVFADRCIAEAGSLRANIEEHAWDGEWYRRAFFDNGDPLGSAQNSECQIDSIAQSWSILSGAADPDRAFQAMNAVDERLVRRADSLIQLFDPPFDQSPADPGYIKGYVPGVRENGGQYTHAAIWTVMAFAKMGDRQRAWELFSLINPIRHGSTAAAIARYKVEPYVIAADVYGVEPHTGRGGWTWYTGSASWMYRLIVESLLGLQLEVNRLRFTPCLPEDWKSFKLHYRYRETVFHITILQPVPSRSVRSVTLDGVRQDDLVIPLQDDRIEHSVEVELE